MKNINSESMKVENNFKFTRYLYEKQEVEIAFVISLLSNKIDESLFWAYELFYSGYKEELLYLLLKIYYYFYACLNPNFENFLIKKIKEFHKNSNIKIIASIVQNLIIRPLNMDVFLCNIIQETFEFEELDSFCLLPNQQIFDKIFNNFNQSKKINIELLIYFIFKSTIKKEELILEDFIDYLEIDINKEKFLMDYKKNKDFLKQWKNKLNRNNEKIILLSKIFYLYGLKKGEKIGKNLYICIKLEDLIVYETIQVDVENNFPAYKILPCATMLTIQPNLCKSLFTLKREKEDIRNAYLNYWLFYAYKSPIWKKRMDDYKAIIVEKDKKVIFEEEELMQSFYNNYGLEPDEQKIEIQNKCIGDDKDKPSNWFLIYKECGFIRRFIDIGEEYIQQLEMIETI